MIMWEYQREKKDKLKKAFESNCNSMTILLTFSHSHGEDVIAISI